MGMGMGMVGDGRVKGRRTENGRTRNRKNTSEYLNVNSKVTQLYGMKGNKGREIQQGTVRINTL